MLDPSFGKVTDAIAVFELLSDTAFSVRMSTLAPSATTTGGRRRRPAAETDIARNAGKTATMCLMFISYSFQIHDGQSPCTVSPKFAPGATVRTLRSRSVAVSRTLRSM